jgi:GNAT superfamily N-acetyltransferase
MSPRNLQINLSGMVRYLHAHASQLDKLTKLAKHRSIRLMQQGTDYNDGIVFEAELFNDFYRDGAALFDEHCAAVGEAPDAWQAKNKALYRRLEELGALQCLTARCNGRMFGYLVSVIAPSLDDPNIQNAEHTLFYAEPGVRNLGMRLQRQALERLRARGIANVMMRAGDRGSGPRLGAIYRRLGAEPYGELYRMPLEEAA